MEEVKEAGYHQTSLKKTYLSRKEIAALLVLSMAFIGVVLYYSLSTFFDSSGGAKRFHIGYIQLQDSPANEENWEGFKSTLENAGYEEDVDVFYSVSQSNGDKELFVKAVNELKRNNVDLFFVQGEQAAELVMNETSDIPVVFSLVSYPKELGLVQSHKSSGTNTAGSRSWVSMEVQMRVLGELFPKNSNIAYIQGENEPSSDLQFQELREYSSHHALSAFQVILTEDNFEESIEQAAESADFFYLSCDKTMAEHWVSQLFLLTAIAEIPEVACAPEYVANGALVGVTYDNYFLGKMAGQKAVELIRGLSISTLSTDTMQIPKILINQERADELFFDVPLQFDSKVDEYF